MVVGGDPLFERYRFELTHQAIADGTARGEPRYKGTFVRTWGINTVDTLFSPFNIVMQSGQAGLGYAAGVHASIMAGMFFEFVTGALAIGFLKTVWDADDQWDGGGIRQWFPETSQVDARMDEEDFLQYRPSVYF